MLLRPLPSDGDRQHYVPWQVPTSIVCLIAEGTITEATGTVIRFRHEQLWFPRVPCSNPYHSNQRCLKQYERWLDGNGHYDGVLREKLRRDRSSPKARAWPSTSSSTPRPNGRRTAATTGGGNRQ
ncbi:hypothetical protein ACWDKQ_00640 [Saccharopolyspora sp. NPDC000995]